MLRIAVHNSVSRVLQNQIVLSSPVCFRKSSRVKSCKLLGTTSLSQNPKTDATGPIAKVNQVSSRSVPFSQRSLIRLLLTEKIVDQRDHAAFEQFCSALEFAVRKHHQRLADEIYPLFGQLRSDEVANRSATADDEFWFLNRLAQLSTKAGFLEADEAQVRNFVEQAHRVDSLIVSANSTRYDVMRCFVLDDPEREQAARVKSEKLRTATKRIGLFGKLFSRITKRPRPRTSTSTPVDADQSNDIKTVNSTVKLSTSRKYKRVLLAYRVKASTFSDLRVLMLKDVALNELDRALPDSARLVQLAPLYHRIVRIAGVLCGSAIVSQLTALYAVQSSYVTLSLASPAALTNAAIWCTFVALSSSALLLGTNSLAASQRAAYERSALDIAQHHVVATSKSLIQLLFERASAETLKEATLAYAFLLKAGATLSESEFYEVRQMDFSQSPQATSGDKTAPTQTASSLTTPGPVFGHSSMSQFLLETMVRKWFADALNMSIAYSADDAVTFLASAGLLIDADDPAEHRSSSALLGTEPSGLISAAVRVGTRGKHLRVLAPLDCAMRALPYNVHFYALGIDPLSQTRLIKTEAKLSE